MDRYSLIINAPPNTLNRNPIGTIVSSRKGIFLKKYEYRIFIMK